MTARLSSWLKEQREKVEFWWNHNTKTNRDWVVPLGSSDHPNTVWRIMRPKMVLTTTGLTGHSLNYPLFMPDTSKRKTAAKCPGYAAEEMLLGLKMGWKLYLYYCKFTFNQTSTKKRVLQLVLFHLSFEWSYKYICTTWILLTVFPLKHSLEDGVCVQVHAADIWWWIVQIKVARIYSNNKWTGGAQHISQCQRAQGNIWAWPVEREDHLRRRRDTGVLKRLLDKVLSVH